MTTAVDTTLAVDTKQFAAAVAWAGKSIASRPSNPTVGGMLIEASGGRMSLSGFDYDAHTQATVDCDGGTAGRWLVSGALIQALVKTFSERHLLRLTTDDDRLVLRCGSATVTLPTMPVEDYPSLPVMPQPVGTVDAEAFARSVARVAAATNSAALPVHFVGLNIVADGGDLHLTATDKYRVGMDIVAWSPSVALADGILVPAEALARLAPALAAAGDVVTLAHAPGLLGLSTESRQAVIRLLQVDGGGAYPDIARLFTASDTTTVRIGVADLKAAVERAALVLEPKAAIRLDITDGAMAVSGGGKADVDQPLPCGTKGGPLTIRCNPAYLTNGLTAVGTAEVDLSFGAAHQPFCIDPVNDDDRYRHIVVPVRSLS